MKILVVDDNEVSRKVLQLHLAKLGYDQVELAEDGFAAVEIASRITFDLIFMDLQMPGMDGVEASARIWELPSYKDKNLFIVAVTAHSISENKKKAESVGIYALIPKPINSDILKNVVSDVINHKHSKEH